MSIGLMKKNPKKSTSIYLSDELDEFLLNHPLGRSEVIKNSLHLFSEVDWQSIKEKAHELGLTPGRLIDVAVDQFSELTPEQQDEKISRYYGKLRRKLENK
jgi:hypothetical protein